MINWNNKYKTDEEAIQAVKDAHNSELIKKRERIKKLKYDWSLLVRNRDSIKLELEKIDNLYIDKRLEHERGPVLNKLRNIRLSIREIENELKELEE